MKLSSICRAYRPRITMKKAGDRLCMHLNDKRIEEVLHNFIAGKVAKRIRKDTLIIVDPSDIQKPYARQMDFLSKVWDGSKGDVGSNLGYYGCMAVACENGGRRPMPMHLRFWSPDAPSFTSENDELEKVFGIIIAATGGRGIFIYDRGGDNIEFYRYFLEKNVDFIVRLKNWGCPTIHRLFTCNPKPTPLNASPSTGLNGACLCVRNQFLPTRGPLKPTLLQELQAALHSSASRRDNRAPRGPYGSLPA